MLNRIRLQSGITRKENSGGKLTRLSLKRGKTKLGGNGDALIRKTSTNLKERNLSKQERTSAEQKAINQWLKTNKPTICPPMRRSDPEIIKKKRWGRQKKK